MIEELEFTLYGPKSPNLDGLPRGGSGPGNPTADTAIKHADLWAKYQKTMAELTDALTEIENAIEVLEPRERTLIRLYYVQGLTWEAVCVEMNYSWSQIHRIHGAALKALRNT
jgi:RNA polymerase sigma factor (sigma-70 family)